MTRAFRRAACGRATPRDRPIPSPNIWNWPDVYEWENRAQDVARRVWAALREAVPWQGRDVLDVGCGDGFHLPLFTGAASVTGVEPHAPLVARARTRLADRRDIRVLQAGAAALPLPDASVDLVHARTAYFFGRGCEPGLAEAQRVLRPGGAIAIVDLDATVPPYGAWMRADLPRYDPAAAEAFFDGPGLHAPPDPDGLALPRPRDPRRRAAHRVQPGRRRARDRRHRRAGDPCGIPAARAPPPLTGADPMWSNLPPRAAIGPVPSVVPVGGDGTVRAQAGRSSGIGGTGPRGGCRLAGGLGGPAQRSGHGGARRRPRGHRVADGAGDPRRRDGSRGRAWTATGDAVCSTLLVVGVGLVVLGGTLLRATGRAELTVPVTVAVGGALLLPLASLLDRRSLLALGAALMLLGAGGAVLALNSAGVTESQGLVGLVGGVLLWAAAAQQAGLTDELRDRIRR